MTSIARFSEIAAAAGDAARAAMLHALLDGRALTAGELARIAGVAPQTASGHLARLVEAGLVAVVRQGRSRYHRLASDAVARMLEGILLVGAEPGPARAPVRTGPADAALRRARTCYDHLAGELGVAIADAMAQRDHVDLTAEAGEVTGAGLAFLEGIGIDIQAMLRQSRTRTRTGRVLCRPCLDWSERRPHLAGLVGAALCRHCAERGWVRPIPGGRALQVTPAGAQALRGTFGVVLR